jgi:hypothetical protein
VIARLPTIQRIAGSRHSLSASFTSRSRPAVRTPTDECATSRYSDNVRRSGTKFADSPLEEAVSSEPVSESRIPCFSGKIQGISSFAALGTKIPSRKGNPNQLLTYKFPTYRNRELIWTYQGINSRYQGRSQPHQGKRQSNSFPWAKEEWHGRASAQTSRWRCGWFCQSMVFAPSAGDECRLEGRPGLLR